jgi:hypothetical protein
MAKMCVLRTRFMVDKVTNKGIHCTFSHASRKRLSIRVGRSCLKSLPRNEVAPMQVMLTSYDDVSFITWTST